MILVSSCLLGFDCRYTGESNLDKELLEFLKDKEYVIACPEQLGGLPTPRKPCEIIDGEGKDVLEGTCRIMDTEGEDVTIPFVKGAEETFKIAKLYNVKTAILKKGSPSCGSINIYDGNFNGKMKKGSGVTAELLRKNNILVLNEDNYREFIK